MGRRQSWVLPIVAVAVTMAGCDSAGISDLQVCNSINPPGIVIEVRDAVTEAPLANETLGLAIDGEYVDTLIGSDATMGGVAGRAGFYRVELHHPEYEPWIRLNIGVTVNDCGQSEKTSLSAALKPRG